MNDDRTLSRRMLDGHEDAFEDFFARFFPGLYRFATARLDGDGDAAEEAVQAALVKAIAKLSTYRGEASLFTWLCTFVRHEIHALCAKRNRTPTEPIEDSPALRAALESLGGDLATDPADLLRRKEVGRLVRVTLDHLPVHYRNALEWKYLDGLPVIEIAARLSLAPKAAESVLTRARQAFRDGFQALQAGA